MSLSQVLGPTSFVLTVVIALTIGVPAFAGGQGLGFKRKAPEFWAGMLQIPNSLPATTVEWFSRTIGIPLIG